MSKISKKLISLFAAFAFILIPLFSDDASSQKGKIIIVILDVSGSIKKQFPDITKIIDRSIVQDRLNVGDYFVLIPFGDSAQPMYSGQLLREEDKASISNTLKVMKADNNFTDIGTAIKTGLGYIVDLKKKDYNLYEPLVLFITDGDITTPETSAFHNQDVDEIFEDELIGNQRLYDGWHYVGIGKNLNDLPLIAKKSGRENYLLRIEDLDGLEFILDDWISKIPEQTLLEQGEVLLDDFRLKSTPLSKDETTLIISSTDEINFNIINTYEKTPSEIEFISADATFQTDDRKTVVPIKINPETGAISLLGSETKNSTGAFLAQSPLKGKGILKIHFTANVNGNEKRFNEEFSVDAKTQFEIVFGKIFPALLIILILALILTVLMIARKFRPVKIVMEVVGKNEKPRPVSMKMKKRIEFGSKNGLAFKLDQELFSAVVGQIQRVGPNRWTVIPRDFNAFNDETRKFDYSLGNSIKLKTKDESNVTIKFKKFKK
ncbi:MAG: VWA domain-containing protein [Treponema sp.]|nr:VWA domain-containing protein [Treponema sp.]